MMKQILIAAAFLGLAFQAAAQNAGHIAKVQNGQSCPGCNLFQADLAKADTIQIRFLHTHFSVGAGMQVAGEMGEHPVALEPTCDLCSAFADFGCRIPPLLARRSNCGAVTARCNPSR